MSGQDGQYPPAGTPAGPGLPSPAGPSEEHAEILRQLRRHVARFCPPWMRDLQDDIVQLAWLRLRQAGERDDRNRNPGTTLMARVAFCATVDESRRLRRRKETSLEAAMDARGPATEQPSRAARSGEIRLAIQDCLHAISERRSLAVTLYLQGHTGPQTARILGWSLTRTENLIYRGLADLRRCLARKGVTP